MIKDLGAQDTQDSLNKIGSCKPKENTTIWVMRRCYYFNFIQSLQNPYTTLGMTITEKRD